MFFGKNVRIKTSYLKSINNHLYTHIYIYNPYTYASMCVWISINIYGYELMHISYDMRFARQTAQTRSQRSKTWHFMDIVL